MNKQKEPISEVFLTDCMEYMKNIPNNYFDIAIVDPPYGIDVANDLRNGIKFEKAAAKRADYEKKDWDKNVPTKEYFVELFRISKNQIIWGVNYYPYDFLTGGRIFWNKDVPEDYSKSKGELAYKSFGYGVDYVKITWHGMIQENMKDKEVRIHPTQKPIQLYNWLLKKYGKAGDKIFDSHMGSQSSRIAAYDLGFDFYGTELDKEYFDQGNKRFNDFTNTKPEATTVDKFFEL